MPSPNILMTRDPDTWVCFLGSHEFFIASSFRPFPAVSLFSSHDPCSLLHCAVVAIAMSLIDPDQAPSSLDMSMLSWSPMSSLSSIWSRSSLPIKSPSFFIDSNDHVGITTILVSLSTPMPSKTHRGCKYLLLPLVIVTVRMDCYLIL
ncbi:hypothetical protein C8J56DRAFT_1165473 [Mycena floridula]|nr:hypothetical protein C8J56DRAFT_1165440 [Mycena floridula]KAJ7586487.1 hypothetical protein C8J56DRAFT_1165473 [Mycena floridula]